MEIKINSLLPFDALITDVDYVFSVVERDGKAIIIKDNKPAYLILKYESHINIVDSFTEKEPNYKLHEAMEIVLLEAVDNTMHASELADEIYKRKLYLRKDGGKAQYTQIRARGGNYSDMFETLPGNYIKLKGGKKQK